MIKKFIGVLLMLTLINTTIVSAYNEIDCSSDIVFESNLCNQCFDGGAKAQGDYIGLLIDNWINPTNNAKLLYKEEQRMPEMINLDPSNVSWSQTPSTEDFWEYSEDFEKLYSEDNFGYILEAGKQVTWLQSKMGYAYKLDNNYATTNKNIGLLMYPISTHVILDDGMPSIEDSEHIECVLFKSTGASEKKPEKKPKKLPDTGPTEYILLLIIAMLLGFGVLRLAKRS